MSFKPIPHYLKNFGKRNKSMNTSWMLGTGVDVGYLQPYARAACLALLVRTFYKELSEDYNRTRQDLIQDTLDIVSNEMNLECTYELAEKLVESLMWSNSKKFSVFSFEAIWFNEETRIWESQRYQFFELDREVSDLSIGYEVYQLTEESQEIVLKSQEIMEQLDVSVQQLIAELFIRKGNFKNALQALDSLRIHVRRLIEQEKELRETIRKNPKHVLFEQKNRWQTRLEDVKKQFQEELEQYTKMEKAINRMEEVKDHEVTIYHLLSEIAKTKRFHDILAKMVIENIQLEIEFRARWYYKLWAIPSPSFKETIWDKKIQKNGFKEPSDMFSLLERLFSPKKDFLFSLEWMIAPQENVSVVSFENVKKEKEKTLIPISLDWDTIIRLWKPFFYRLLANEKISIEELNDLDTNTLSEWVHCREAFDFWIAFASMEAELLITEEQMRRSTDDKMVLIKKLIEEDDAFRDLYYCTIYTQTLVYEPISIMNEIHVYPYEILLEKRSS